jgi:two-component system, OmpR family, response regulator CssR
MHTICYVEDEINLSNLIKTYLENAGYQVVCFTKGQDAINYIGNKCSLWILDIMLGDDISGYDIIKAIREKDQDVPVIFTSARDQDLDKILGLELGSDDYITKPYSSKELVLRVNKIIKRVYKDSNIDLINYECYSVDTKKRVASNIDKNIEIKLTTLEFDLLVLFLNNINKSFSREEILNSVWGNDYFGSDRVVDDLVRRLRKKMPKLKLSAIYGYGYRLS